MAYYDIMRIMITSNKFLRLSWLTILILFIGFGIIATLTTPFSSGSDEVAHFRFGRFIAEHQRLPITMKERVEAGYKSDLPPLYHLQFGLLGSWLDLESPPYIKFITNNSRLQLVSGIKTINVWGTLHTTDPPQGEHLLWYIGRWVTLLNAAICLILVYQMIRAVWSEQLWLAIIGTSFLASLPTFFINSLVITYEPMLGMWMAAYFLLLFHTLKYPQNPYYYLGLGLLLGLAVSTKYTPIPIILLLCVLIIWLAKHNQWSLMMLGTRLSLMLGGVALFLGSWILFTVIYFNQIKKYGLLMGLIRTFLASDGSDTTSMRLVHIFSGGTQGVQNTVYQDGFLEWLYYFFSSIVGNGLLSIVMLPLSIMALVGMILRLRWKTEDSFVQTWIIVLICHFAFLLILPFIRFIMTQEASTGSGRHLLFPGAIPLLILFIYGLRRWFSLFYITLLFLILLPISLVQSYGDYQHNLMERFPVQTIPLANETSLIEYEEIVLVNSHVVADSEQLTVKLWWRVERLINQDYQLELTLIDETNTPQTRWRGQPLDGLYPTRAWFPQDRIHTDINMPIAGLSMGNYSLKLRLLSETGKPISSMNNSSNDSSETLVELSLTPAPFSPTNQLLVDGEIIGYTFWQQREPLNEWATVLVATDPILPQGTQIQLIGPANRTYDPIDHIGRQSIFQITPPFVEGAYFLQISEVTSPPLLTVKPQRRQFEIGPLANPVEANFANRLALLGYDLPKRTALSGQTIPVTLHWQALHTIGADLIFFIHLIGPDGQRWANHERMAHDLYSTMLWAPHEIVSDSFALQIDPQAPAGNYQLLVGVYLPVGQAVSLPLMKDGDYTDVTHVNLGEIRVE